MRWSFQLQIAIGGCLVVLGFIVGWWLRSERLNDDYQAYAPMHRPKLVPRQALWVGGPDGGSYIDCHDVKTLNYDDCTIYNDWTGAVKATGHFTLKGQNRAATSTELKYSVFDGNEIYLDLPPVDGRIPSLILSNQ